jgi:hypothetical protein
MLSQYCGRNISHTLHVGRALVLVVVSSGSVLAQSTKIDPRLVGIWHSVEIRCAAHEDCSDTVNEAQLSVGKTGSFEWVRYEDLTKSDVCSYKMSNNSPNTLDDEDCHVLPDQDSDRFEYRLSGNSLILTGIEVNPKLRELISMRFERGPLIPKWRELEKPEPETCDPSPLPRWAKSATQIASDGDLERSRPTDSLRLIRVRNRLLWDAVRAYSGRRPPIALKTIGISVEGDKSEKYLFVSRDHVEVIDHHEEGMIEHLNTCVRRAVIIKLKVQDSNKLWRFVTSAPSSSATRAYVVFPSMFPGLVDAGSDIFPRY